MALWFSFTVLAILTVIGFTYLYLSKIEKEDEEAALAEQFEPKFTLNRDKIRSEMDEVWESLYDLRDQESYKVLLRQIELAYQTEVLDRAGLKPGPDGNQSAYHYGRLRAFGDILDATKLAFDQVKVRRESKGKETASLKMTGSGRPRSSAKISF